MDTQEQAQGCPAEFQTYGDADSIASVYPGASVASSPALVAAANPITFIDGSEPPFLIQNGDRD